MKKQFYSNGKLLLTGEYVVLDGATGLSLPTVYGQDLTIKTELFKEIKWKSLDHEKSIWFSDEFDLKNLQSMSQNPNQISNMMSHILLEARKLNPSFLSKETGFEIHTHLNFPRNWGLGTSSTLINNISKWAEVNPFQLLERTFGGSGYDIAAAQHNQPILYTKSHNNIEITPVLLQWEFTNNIFFIYLNKKQNSRTGIAHYRKTKPNHNILQRISEISKHIYKVTELDEFELLLKEHEQLISKSVNLPTLQSKLFSDYPGTVKSLGAWGGDFFLATGNKEEMVYFKEKGFDVIISFQDMVLHKPES